MNDINELMDRNPNEATDADIDEIIAWFRKQRAAKLDGTAKTKAKAQLDIDLAELGIVVEPEVKINRRELK